MLAPPNKVVKTEQGKLNRQDYQVRVGSQGGFFIRKGEMKMEENKLAHDRNGAILGLIADFSLANSQLREELKQAKIINALEKDKHAESLGEIRALEYILRSIKANLQTALHEKVVLEKEDIEKLLELVNEGLENE